MIYDSSKSYTAQVNNLLAVVGQIGDAHQKAKDLYLRRFAPDYNTFDFIEPDEMRLSKILAWFLDPHQTHGQGCLFLRLFLETLKLDIHSADCGRAEIRTEVSIKGGRLDILVTMAGLHVIVENKPWAGDQDTQLNRYFAHFDNLAVSHRYQVIYLTSKGRVPPEHSISEAEKDRRIKAEQLRLWSYDKDVLMWLKRCRAECRADRIIVFVNEFSRYIQTTFEGVNDRVMSDHLLDEIVASADRVAAAMQVILMTDSIRKRLLSDLENQLRSRLPCYKVDLNDNAWEKYSGITIDFSETSPYQFGMEFQSTQYNDLVIGISRKEEKSPALANEYTSLVSSFGAASQSDWWLWYRPASPTDSLLPVPRHWGTSAEPWVQIASGKLAPILVNALTRALDVLKGCGVG